MKRTIAILGKSRKLSGYCVAGIDMKTNEWVRLEHPKYSSLSHGDLLISGNKECEVLDVVEVQCLDNPSNKPYQPENVTLNTRYNLRFLYKTSWSDILPKIKLSNEENGLILGIDSRFDTVDNIAKLNDMSSLQLIKVSDLSIYSIYNPNSFYDTIKASFTYGGKHWSSFSVTDFAYRNIGNSIKLKSAYLVVSRGLPFKPSYQKESYHYSLIGQVIPDPAIYKTAS